MRLETERQGRWFARRVIFKLAKAGTEACRANDNGRAQSGALRCALIKLFQKGTREALSGFACVLTDALGSRPVCTAMELAQLYEEWEARGIFRQWSHDSATGNGDNVPGADNGSLYPAKGSAPSPALQIATADRGRFARLT